MKGSGAPHEPESFRIRLPSLGYFQSPEDWESFMAWRRIVTLTSVSTGYSYLLSWQCGKALHIN